MPSPRSRAQEPNPDLGALALVDASLLQGAAVGGQSQGLVTQALGFQPPPCTPPSLLFPTTHPALSLARTRWRPHRLQWLPPRASTLEPRFRVLGSTHTSAYAPPAGCLASGIGRWPRGLALSNHIASFCAVAAAPRRQQSLVCGTGLAGPPWLFLFCISLHHQFPTDSRS